MYLALNEEEAKAYADVDASFNTDVAENFMKTIKAMYDGEHKMLTLVSSSLLIAKTVLTQYVEATYPESNQDAPTELRNAGYYIEQCLASLCAQYQEQRIKEPKFII